jgi:hypothetical protein
MKKMLLLLSLVFAMCVVSQPVLAEETGAGCGLGKILFEGKSGKSPNIAAAILNVFPIPNTFFMSTAASMGEELLGCDPSTTVLQEEQKRVFVAANMDNLSRDMAQGNGAHLAALATVMGIADEDRPAFYQMSQEEYGEFDRAASDSPAAMVAALNTAMLERPVLVKYIQ